MPEAREGGELEHSSENFLSVFLLPYVAWTFEIDLSAKFLFIIYLIPLY